MEYHSPGEFHLFQKHAVSIFCYNIEVYNLRKLITMSEQELNSYRFNSGEEPSDEMLKCIMKEVAEDAMARRRDAQRRLDESVDRQRKELRAEWSKRLGISI